MESYSFEGIFPQLYNNQPARALKWPGHQKQGLGYMF